MFDQKEYSRQWRLKNKDKKADYDKKRRERYHLLEKDNPEYRIQKRNRELKQKYGLTHNDYLLQLEYQNNVCAICNKTGTKGRYLHIDHDHSNGRFRGVLCHQCNWYMGLVDADPEIKVRLMNYGKYTDQVHPDIKQVDKSTK